MMGFGTFDHRGGGGGGGSSSTSNLSPLAPPFTIDQSISKPKPKPSPMISGHFAEDPYPFSYTASHGHGNWFHPQTTTSLSDSFSTPNLKLELNCAGSNLPSDSSYGQSKPYYFGSQSTNNFGAPTSTLSLATASVAQTSPFPYAPQFDGMVNTLNKGEPYYPQYPSATIHDENSPIVVSKPASDMRPISAGSPHLEMSSHNDYSESLFSVDYTTPPWNGGFWSGVSEWDQSGRKDPYGSFGWNEKNGAGSSTWKTPVKQGVLADGFSTVEKGSTLLNGKSVESLSGKCHIGPKGTDLLDAKCSSALEENARVTPFNMSSSIFGPAAAIPEMPYPQEQHSESATSSWREPIPNSNSFTRCFAEPDSCTTDPTVFYQTSAYASSAFKSYSPAIDSSFSGPNKKVLASKVNVIGPPGTVCDDVDNPAGYMSVVQLGAYCKQGYGDESGTSNKLVDRADHIFASSSPAKNGMPSSQSAATHSSSSPLFKAQSQNHVNQCNLSNAFTLTSAAQDSDAVENPVETSDQLSHAVDSPCWKGAPASRISPFAFSESGNVVEPFLKSSDHRVFSVNDEDALAKSSPRPHGELACNGNGGGEYGNSKSSSRCKPFEMMRSSLEKGNVTSVRLLGCTIADPGMHVKIPAHDGSTPVLLNSKDHVSASPSSGVSGSTESAEPHREASDAATIVAPKLDARLLVNTMHNLSKLLLSVCSNGADSLLEQDNKALQHVIDNLGTCILKKAESSGPMLESQPPETTDIHKGTATARSQVRSVVPDDIQSQMHVLSGKKQEVIQDFVSQSGDSDFEKDNGIGQAIEKALKEDFYDEEESLPQVILYKNLWLEAEAALCSMKYKARFARMKIEMEKPKLQAEKGILGSTIHVEEGSRTSSDQKGNDTSEPVIKESLNANLSTVEPSQSSSNSQVENIEASVMARLNILKRRGENPSDMSKEAEELTQQPINIGTRGQPADANDRLPLGERMKPWPFVRDGSEAGIHSEVGNIPHIMFPTASFTGNGAGLNRDISEDPGMEKELDAYIAAGAMSYQAYTIPNTIGKRLPLGGYDMDSLSSSDWEHVLKEEFTWKN